jgi:hypothetical protein
VAYTSQYIASAQTVQQTLLPSALLLLPACFCGHCLATALSAGSTVLTFSRNAAIFIHVLCHYSLFLRPSLLISTFVSIILDLFSRTPFKEIFNSSKLSVWCRCSSLLVHAQNPNCYVHFHIMTFLFTYAHSRNVLNCTGTEPHALKTPMVSRTEASSITDGSHAPSSGRFICLEIVLKSSLGTRVSRGKIKYITPDSSNVNCNRTQLLSLFPASCKNKGHCNSNMK